MQHPLLPGVELAIDLKRLELSEEQFMTLCDELCSIAFCCPHLETRIDELAAHLGLEPVRKYVFWLRERRAAA